MNEIEEVFVSNKRQITVENRSEEQKDTNNSSKKPLYSLDNLINIRKESLEFNNSSSIQVDLTAIDKQINNAFKKAFNENEVLK